MPKDVIAKLQEIQEKEGYLSEKNLNKLSKQLDISLSELTSVATFYSQFTLKPKGKYIIRICRGTACHVRGGKTILKLVKQQLGLEEGETTPDMEYTLETVACIGVCALAPNIVVNRTTYGHMNPKKVAFIFSRKEET